MKVEFSSAAADLLDVLVKRFSDQLLKEAGHSALARLATKETAERALQDLRSYYQSGETQMQAGSLDTIIVEPRDVKMAFQTLAEKISKKLVKVFETEFTEQELDHLAEDLKNIWLTQKP